jgi:hypothetical protein
MSSTDAPPAVPPVLEGRVRLVIGAANFAGQGRAWARAVENLPGVAACSFSIGESPLTTAGDYMITRADFDDALKAQTQERWVESFTHVLMEAGRPVTGITRGKYANGDYAALVDKGLCVGLVAHGSDVRRPDRHMDREPDSPFFHDQPSTVAIRQAYADLIAPLTDACPWGFVSTPDLLEDVPRARWLPVVVDPARWDAAPWHPARRGTPPKVVHVPSDSFMKGTERIEPALHQLAEAGRIDYTPLRGIPQQDMPTVIASADIVLDQFALGSYGVAAVEAMATGRVVVGHVRPEVRAHVEATTGLELPIVQSRASEVVPTLEAVLADADAWEARAEAGRIFALAVHDGRFSAGVLRDFLLLGQATPRSLDHTGTP